MPLHPQARAFLDALAAADGPGWDEMPPAEARKVFSGLKELFGSGPELHEVVNRSIAGKIPIRIYRPSDSRPLPVVMFFHGGGWVLGDLDTHDTLCRRLAAQSGCAFVSVGYRLAPEHPFPAALEDCHAATLYISEHAEGLGFEAARLAVCGDSAGGNLAAAVAMKARNTGSPPIHSQWLIYPVIAPDFATQSYREFAEGHGLSRANMRWFWDQYAPGDSRQNPLAAPLGTDSLKDLPPAHIYTAEYDVLRDEGEAYAAALKKAGIPVQSKQYAGMIHGFIHFSEPIDDAKTAIAEIAKAISGALRASKINE